MKVRKLFLFYFLCYFLTFNFKTTGIGSTSFMQLLISISQKLLMPHMCTQLLQPGGMVHQWMEPRHLEDGVIVAAFAHAMTAPCLLMPCLVQQHLMPIGQRAITSLAMHLVSGASLPLFLFFIFEYRAPF
jgi:hypothetical protein